MNQETFSQTALDEMVGTDRTQMLKAAVPYLPARSRKFISIYAKLTELFNTLSLFSPETQSMSICDTPADPLDMLRDMRSHCSGSAGKQLDQMLSLYAMMEMSKLMNEPSGEKGAEP